MKATKQFSVCHFSPTHQGSRCTAAEVSVGFLRDRLWRKLQLALPFVGWASKAALIGALILLSYAPTLQAGGVVQSCTELAFRAALVGGGSVTFTNDCTITLSQQIPIFSATTIDAQGHAVVISGNSAVPLFDAAANLTLRGINLVNGKSTTSGAALVVRPSIVVVVSQCTFGENSVVATNGLAGTIGGTNSNGTGLNGSPGMDAPAALGGAIYNQGDLALINCTFTNNSAIAGAGGAGGAGGNGGGLFEIGGNGANGGAGGRALGGAVYNGSNLTVMDCNFFLNSVTGGSGGSGGAGGTGSNAGLAGDGGSPGSGSGGAIYNALNLTLMTSTFSTNSATGGAAVGGGTLGNGTGIVGKKGSDGAGGALFNNWWAVATNCTFYTNTVFGGAGGNGGNGSGLFAVPGNGGDGGDGVGGSVGNANTLTVVTCTFSSGGAFGATNGVAGTGHRTASNGNPGSGEGGNIANSGMLSLFGTILTSSVSGQNAFGAISDLGYNLSSDSISSFGKSSLQNKSPQLGPLTLNGGPTPTMALLFGSPAIDRIPANLTPPTDQRGFPRPANRSGDIGAFELGAATNVVVTNISLSVSRPTGGAIEISGQGSSGASYLVQASTNLINWQTVATNVSTIQFTDPVTNRSTRFYRLSW